MKFQVQTRGEEVAGGRSATSSQLRCATADLMPRLCFCLQPPPDRPASATRTNGAPHEGLLFAPLAARSQKYKRFINKPFQGLSLERGIFR
jgi:hypothetical protein